MAVKKQFASFDDLLANAELPVLVDFYATWCGPCQLMASILEEVNLKMGDRIQIVKIDTDKYEELALKWHIYALPTLVLFKKGQPVDRIEGVLNSTDLITRLESFLQTSP